MVISVSFSLDVSGSACEREENRPALTCFKNLAGKKIIDVNKALRRRYSLYHD